MTCTQIIIAYVKVNTGITMIEMTKLLPRTVLQKNLSETGGNLTDIW